MLFFFKRLLTALVMLVVLFFVLYHGSMIVGATIVGARIGMQQKAAGNRDRQANLRLGVQAELQFMAENRQAIRLGALAAATIGALGLTFGGVLPWCRETVPSPLRRSPYR